MLRRPLWEDEVFTVWAARLPFEKLLDLLRTDSGPPLFYLLEKPFVSLSESAFSSDLPARALPFLCAALLFAGVFFLPRDGARRRYGLLIASSPLIFLYSTEARAYTLLSLLCFFLFLIVTESKPAPGGIAAIAALSAAALYTHYLALFAVAALLFIALALGRRRETAGLLAGIALFLPWVPVLLSQPAAALAWSEEKPAESLWGFLAALGGAGRIPAPLGPPLPAPVPLLGGALALLFLFFLVPLCRKDLSVRNAVVFVFFVLVGVLLVSFWRPIAFAGRSEMAVLPVWLWALSRGSERSVPVRWGARGAILLGLATCLFVSFSEVPVPAARPALATLLREAREGDVLFAGAGFYLPARLAWERGELKMPVHPFPASVAEHPGWFAPDAPTLEDYRDLKSARERAAATNRVFLLIPPSYRTLSLEAIGSPPGWREAGRSRDGVLLVWTAEE